VRAGARLLLDDRALPKGRELVAEGPFAAIATEGGLALAGVALDDCFTEIDRTDEPATVVFSPGPRSRPVTITLGEQFRYLMCFTGDTLKPPRRRRAMAIEPMTCAPNGLRTGEGRTIIDPGAIFSDAFTIALG
jgi:aldose 1-epimerase